MARTPHSEHARHGAFPRTSRSKRLGKWLAARGTALQLSASEFFTMFQKQGADQASKATTSLPAARTRPAITGTATSGQTLTSVAGTWGGKPTPTIAKSWYRDGVVVAGQTANTYVLGAGDVGKKITVRETATNTAGVKTNTSLPTATVA